MEYVPVEPPEREPTFESGHEQLDDKAEKKRRKKAGSLLTGLATLEGATEATDKDEQPKTDESFDEWLAGEVDLDDMVDSFYDEPFLISGESGQARAEEWDDVVGEISDDELIAMIEAEEAAMQGETMAEDEEPETAPNEDGEVGEGETEETPGDDEAEDDDQGVTPPPAGGAGGGHQGNPPPPPPGGGHGGGNQPPNNPPGPPPGPNVPPGPPGQGAGGGPNQPPNPPGPNNPNQNPNAQPGGPANPNVAPLNANNLPNNLNQAAVLERERAQERRRAFWLGVLVGGVAVGLWQGHRRRGEVRELNRDIKKIERQHELEQQQREKLQLELKEATARELQAAAEKKSQQVELQRVEKIELVKAAKERVKQKVHVGVVAAVAVRPIERAQALKQTERAAGLPWQPEHPTVNPEGTINTQPETLEHLSQDSVEVLRSALDDRGADDRMKFNSDTLMQKQGAGARPAQPSNQVTIPPPVPVVTKPKPELSRQAQRAQQHAARMGMALAVLVVAIVAGIVTLVLVVG